MMRHLHRRGFLGSAASLLAAGATSAAVPPPLPDGHVAICREIRRRLAEVRRLISAEMALEGEPGHAAAELAAVSAEHAFESFCDELVALPVKDWSDVVVRAEVARASSQFTLRGVPSSCDDAEGNCRDGMRSAISLPRRFRSVESGGWKSMSKILEVATAIIDCVRIQRVCSDREEMLFALDPKLQMEDGCMISVHRGHVEQVQTDAAFLRNAYEQELGAHVPATAAEVLVLLLVAGDLFHSHDLTCGGDADRLVRLILQNSLDGLVRIASADVPAEFLAAYYRGRSSWNARQSLLEVPLPKSDAGMEPSKAA